MKTEKKSKYETPQGVRALVCAIASAMRDQRDPSVRVTHASVLGTATRMVVDAISEMEEKGWSDEE